MYLSRLRSNLEKNSRRKMHNLVKRTYPTYADNAHNVPTDNNNVPADFKAPESPGIMIGFKFDNVRCKHKCE